MRAEKPAPCLGERLRSAQVNRMAAVAATQAARRGHSGCDCGVAQQDFRAFLASLEPRSVDLALTDPPYAISRKTGFSRFKNGVERLAVSMDFGPWDRQPIDLAAMAEGLHRALRTGGTAIVWYDLWKITTLADALSAAGFKMLRALIWQKTNPVPLNSKATYLSNSREVAIVGVKGGKPTFHGQYHDGTYRYPIPRHGGKRTHPTQKPLELFRELIQTHSDPGDRVIDPFLGGGTTAVAALQEGRRFTGCEIDPGYAKAAKEWIARERRRPAR